MIKKSDLYKEIIGRVIFADATHYQSDWIADRVAKHLKETLINSRKFAYMQYLILH